MSSDGLKFLFLVFTHLLLSTSRSITHLLLSIPCSSRSSDEIVRPRVPLEACLASFTGPEEVDFYSTALKTKTTAIKYVCNSFFIFIIVDVSLYLLHLIFFILYF